MNVWYLKYAVEVERTGSITQAAENLYMAQPNLSKAIKELEKEIGFAIFKRTPRGMVPTGKGLEFLNRVKPILRQLDDLEMLYQPDNRLGTRFRISVPRSSYITHAFTNFIQRLDFLQGMEISYKETDLSQTIADISKGGYPLGIIRYYEDEERLLTGILEQQDLEIEPLFLYEARVLLSEQHPLAGKAEIEEKELDPFIELVYGHEYLPGNMRDRRTEVFRDPERLKKIQIYERASQMDLLGEIPMSYIWSSPIPHELAQKYHLRQLKCRTENPKIKDVFVYARGYRMNSLEKAFWEELIRVRNEIAKQE